MAQDKDRTAVLLIAHGSRHAPANDDLHGLARRLARLGRYPIVEPCFLELADPDIAQGGARCVARGATRVLMIPYFLSAGVHLLRDLAAARDDLQRRHPGVEFRLGPPLGPHPLLEQLVAERIGQLDAAAAPPPAPPADPGPDVEPGPEPERPASEAGRRHRIDPSPIDTIRPRG